MVAASAAILRAVIRVLAMGALSARPMVEANAAVTRAAARLQKVVASVKAGRASAHCLAP